jgi:hypothetical protein
VLSRDFSEFIASLNAREVRYLIVGGYAVAFHGHPRYTKDLDVWVERTPENAERLLRALGDFGFGGVGLTAEDFLVPDRVVQLGYPPARIDLLTSCEGVDFEPAYARRETLEVGGVAASFIGIEELRQNKRALGRHQDLADLDRLE